MKNYAAFLISKVVLPAYTSPELVGVDLVILAAGVAVYFVCVRWRDKPPFVRRAMRERNFANKF